MIKNFTLKRKRTGMKIISFLTLIFSMAALQSMGQQIWEFDYTGNVQTLELPPGKYKFEAWGAEGAEGYNTQGGHGGFAEGVINFEASTTAYIVVGGAGTNQTGGYNGGGNGGIDQSSQNGGAGGGATHIATSNGLLSTLAADLSSIKIVAGGGAGGGRDGDTGDAGGLSGLSSTIYNSGRPGTGGTQSEGGTAFITTRGAENGSFGQGGSGSTGYNSAGGGGGGGGFYGGGGGTSTQDHGSGYSSGGGGGSSYIANLTEELTIAGNSSIPDPQGGQMIGNTGNGFVRITQLYFVSLFDKTDASCPESADGSISAQINGGAAPYTFEWSNGLSSNSIDETELSENENLLPGEYTVTVTDANGAETTGVYVIGPDPIEVSIDMTQSNSCDENGDGTLTANVTGGTAPYAYVWSSGETDAAISNKAFGEYTVTVTDANDCASVEGTESITVNDNVAPVALVQDIEVFLDANGAASIIAEDIDNGSSDDCSIASMSIDVSEFSCEDVAATPSFDGGTAIDLDGDDDRIEFDEAISYSSDHTIATWVKMDGSESGAIFTWGSPTANNYISFLVQSGRIRYISGNGNPNPPNVAGSTFIGDNEWHHIAITRNASGDITLYLDGNQEATGNLTTHVNNPTQTSIGGGLFNGAYQLNLDCELDEFAYWTEELSAEEIQSIICSGPQGSEVFIDFEGGSTTAVSDQSGNGNSAAMINMDAESDLIDFGESKNLPACPVGKRVVLSVTDAGENVSESAAYVTVSDTISPTVSSKSFTVELGANGIGALSAEDVDNGSTDNCAIDEMSVNKSSFTCEDLGTNEVIMSVTDIHGNSKSTAAEVQVVDNLKPTLSVQNVQVSLDADGNASISTSDAEVSSADNCGIAGKSLSLTSFSCEDLGQAIEVDMTVTDGSGNAQTESFEVTVIEENAPTADPQAYTVALDENGLVEFNQTMIDDFIGGNDTDDCSGIDDDSRSIDQTQFSCEDLGENTVTYSVSDLSGNTGTAPVVITIVDEMAPTAIAQDIVAELDENGIALISATDADNGSTDNCSIASREVSIAEFTCEELGDQEVTLTVADGSGNESEVTFTVSVVDQVAPVIAETLSTTVYLDDEGQGIFDTAPLLDQATDNCGLDAIVVEGEGEYVDINGFPFSCEEVGLSAGPLFVRDNSGNLTEFNFELSVQDTIKPSLNLEVIQLQSDDDGNAALTEAMLLPYAADNCGIAEVAIEIGAFDCSDMGETQYTEIVVFDSNGNTKQQTLGVVIKDQIAPEIQVENIVIELDADGQAGLNPEMLDMMIMENCTVNQMEIAKTEFSCADLGENANTIIASDLGGNNGEAGFNVTVVDNMAPTISGPLVISLCEGSPVNYGDFSATDNCSANMTVADGPQEGDMLATGEYMVEFEAVDPSGNSSTYMAMLDVRPVAEVDLGEDMVVAEGTEVTLVAGNDNENTYLWSNGGTGDTYQFVATEDVVVSVEITTPEGCVSTDGISITIDNALSVAEDSEGNKVRFFPNPTQGQLSVEYSLNQTSEDLTLSVFDISGKKVVEKMIPAEQSGEIFRLDLTDFANGIYLVNLMSGDFNLTERVVKH